MLKRMLNIQGIGERAERGDAPAQAILQANSRAQALRKATETQEELTKIRERVTRTLDTYDLSEKLSAGVDKAEVERITDEFLRQQATLEFVDDMTQLMVILGDPVAKRKYQQHVTVFIVGYENLCGRRAKLLAQLQEFFTQNMADDDKFELEPIEFDLEDVGEQVREALKRAEDATERLALVSKDVMKALELANPKETKKGKKKLEKSLQQSHQDIMSLTEKLLKLQNDLDENENKLGQMQKSMEMKQVEIQRLKVQADNGKKASDLANELKAELAAKDLELQQHLKAMNEMELNIAQIEDKQDRDFERQKKIKEENQREKEEYEQKIRDLQQYVESVRTEMQQHYDSELKKVRHEHEMTLYYLNQDHETALKRKERVIETAKKKNEELKSELSAASDSSKRNSLTTGSPLSKRGSLFSPDTGSDVEFESSRLSLKSSAQSVRMMLSKSGSATDTTPVQSPLSRQASKEASAQATSTESAAAETRAESVKGERTRSDLKDRKYKTPEVKSGRKSRSPQKLKVKVKTPEEQLAEEQAQKAQGDQATKETLETSEAGIQSEGDAPEESADQAPPRPPIQRTSTLMTLPELEPGDEAEDDVDWAILSPEDLLARAEIYKAKSLAKREKLESDLAEWKTRYLKKTDSLRKELAENQGKYAEERNDLLNRVQEAEALKEQAKHEAEQAVLQLEDFLAEQEEMRQLQQRKELDKHEEMTMTGLSLDSGTHSPDKQERDTMTGMSLESKQALQSDSHHSFMSRGVSPFPIMESSTQEDTVGEDHHESRGISPRDSGFEGAGSSARFESRPGSGSNHVIVQTPKVEVATDAQSIQTDPTPVSRSSTLTAPRRELVMSARARRRLVSSALRDHPVASESLRTYDSVMRFKDSVTRWLDREGVTEGADELKGLDMTVINREDLAQVIERLPEIRYSIGQVLEKVDDILASQSLRREVTFAPSTRTEGESTFHELTGIRDTAESEERGSSPADEPSRDKSDIQSSYVKLLKEYNDLAEGYESLRRHMDEETKFHQEQTSQNAALMAEMQDTINQLRLQLADAMAGRTGSPARASSSIMFSRLDAERNAKILTRAMNERRIQQENVTDVVNTMSDYVSLPAKRLAHMVRRYSHHRAMQEIEEELKKSSGSLSDNVLHTLERMEVLQNDRARRWGDKMDEMADTRERLAQLMMETFQRLESDTGIFLIKPVLSYQGRSDPPGGYMLSQKKPSINSYRPPANSVGPATPAPTPWLNKSKSTTSVPRMYREMTNSSIQASRQLENGAMDMDVSRPGVDSLYQGSAWQVSRSQVNGDSPSNPGNLALSTPKILELDVNRMMLGQTHASTAFIGSLLYILWCLIVS
ncbi:uncharacterized protein LOC5503188 isoform X2 [Nematostella vectensis]|uniref:uncharacterized protein LOC5503188 isoform X2 n=1 Tax=Nematostella vectensis TaxID=45351 RepID=UPI002077777C|nr:uncharacterized protein LOC5503188 isoform X2 [Nematostella vectensis]